MKNEAVIQSFLDKKDAKNSNKSLWTEGNVLYSYGRHFPLAVFKDGKLFVNESRYSVTTTKHQNKTRTLARMSGLKYTEKTTEELQKMI